MKMKLILSFFVSVFGLSLTAFADHGGKHKAKADGESSSYEEPWGMAGCGLYTYIIKEKSQGAQLGHWALKTFVFYDFQTSAISSGTSNCVSSRSELASQEQEVFITVNLANLSKEAAQGQGEHLNALAEVFGCPHSEFSALSQSRYKEIYGTYEPNAVLANYRREMRDAQLAQTCQRAS